MSNLTFLRRDVLVGAATLAASRALACGPVSPDPIAFSEVSPTDFGLSDITGKTIRTAPLDLSTRLCVIVTLGQSQTINIAPSLYTPANVDRIDNLNIYDGLRYAAIDPLLGCQGGGGNWITRFCDKVLASPILLVDRIIVAPIAIGGTGVADWMNGPIATRIPAVAARLSAIGIKPTLIFWNQGEKDNRIVTTPDSYTAMGSEIVANIRRVGWDAPFFVAIETWYNGVVSTDLQGAQQAMVDPANGIFLGPNMDSLGSSFRLSDLTHINDAGSDALATLSLSAVLGSGVPLCGASCPV